MKRLLFAFFCVLTLLSLFASCKAADYRQDVSPYELANYLEAELGGERRRALDDKAAFYDDLLPSAEQTSFSLRVAEDGSNLDEFGIFACADATEAKALADEVKAYLNELDRTNREWYLSYIPAEVPKVQNAEVKTFGRYVAYAILGENDRNRLFDLLRQKLLQ